MIRRWRILPLLGLLFLCGCTANSLETLTRDHAAVQTDCADYLMFVVDESSADTFQKTIFPRLKQRAEDLKKKMEMWEKKANDDQKKKKDRLYEMVLKVRVGVAAGTPPGVEMHEDIFENEDTYVVGQEMVAAQNRCIKEQERVEKLISKLLADGVDCPQLVKCRTVSKDLGVLEDKK
jgi:hypothetical protein